MKTVGVALKEARNKKRYSRVRLGKESKIKEEFIVAIEEENWEKLTEYPVTQGFIKTLARILEMEMDSVMALLRRDYPPKKLNVNPKPDVSEKFRWSPRLTFILGIIVITFLIIGYLTLQYINFVKPPRLELTQPTENQEIVETIVVVEGITDPDSTVIINRQPVIVSDSGGFSAEIEIFAGTAEIEVIAKSRSGKETTLRRTIIPKLGE